MAKFDISPEIRRTLFWSGIITLVFIVGNLAVWYLFISKQQQTVDQVSEARGFGAAIPSFEGGGGSLRENVSGIFSTTFQTIRGDGSTTSEAVPGVTQATPRLWRVNDIPSTGLTYLSSGRSATSSGLVRFVDRTTGHIFARAVSSGSEPVRITNTLFPYVHEVIWIDDDSLVIRHSEDGGVTLKTWVGSIVQATTTGAHSSLEGGYLEAGTLAIAVNPARKEPMLFYLLKTDDGVAGILARSDGSSPDKIWESSLRGWRIDWVAPGAIALLQKASSGVAGSMYLLAPATGKTQMLFRNREGLGVVRKPDGIGMLYSIVIGSDVKLFSVVGSNRRELPISTFAEKCIWSRGTAVRAYCAVPSELPDSLPLPDAWYRGETHFSDKWFVVDPTAGTAEPLLDPVSDFGVSLDVVDPALNPAGDTILFTDKKTGTAWTVRIAL